MLNSMVTELLQAAVGKQVYWRELSLNLRRVAEVEEIELREEGRLLVMHFRWMAMEQRDAAGNYRWTLVEPTPYILCAEDKISVHRDALQWRLYVHYVNEELIHFTDGRAILDPTSLQ